MDVWRGWNKEGADEGNGLDDELGRGEEVRKWMRQSYWDSGSVEGGGREEGASDERN